MTKRGSSGRRRRKNRRRTSSPGERIEVVEGQQLFISTTNGTVNTIPVAPSSFTRVAAIADNFQFYRCTKLRVKVFPTIENSASGSSNNGSLAVGYLPGAAPDTPPANEPSVLALPFTTFMSNGQTVPSWMSVPRRELVANGVLKWYKTIAGTPAEQFETQGNIYSFGVWSTTPTIGINFMIYFRFELQAWALAGNTPLSIVPKDVSKLREYVAEKEAIKQASKTLTNGKIVEIEGIKFLRLTD